MFSTDATTVGLTTRQQQHNTFFPNILEMECIGVTLVNKII